MGWEQVTEHERRITTLEANQESMASRLELNDNVSALRLEMAGMHHALQQHAKNTEEQISRIASDFGDAIKRLSGLNDEMMRDKARQVQEAHEKELALKDASITELKSQAEARRWQNRLKNDWLPLAGIITALWAVVNYASQILAWLIKALS